MLQLRLQRRSPSVDSRRPRHNPTKPLCTNFLHDYFDAYLAWDTAHGWHRLWGWNEWVLGNGLDSELTIAASQIGNALKTDAAVDRMFEHIAKTLGTEYDERAVKIGCIAPLVIRRSSRFAEFGEKGQGHASATPNPKKHPPSAGNDSNPATLYWPGALVEDNTEWFQLTWETPQTFDRVFVHFLQHPSMRGRTIRLQKETAPDKWEDFATAVIPNDPDAPHAVAAFRLAAPVTLDKIRVVNLLDLFEIEVR